MIHPISSNSRANSNTSFSESQTITPTNNKSYSLSKHVSPSNRRSFDTRHSHPTQLLNKSLFVVISPTPPMAEINAHLQTMMSSQTISPPVSICIHTSISACRNHHHFSFHNQLICIWNNFHYGIHNVVSRALPPTLLLVYLNKHGESGATSVYIRVHEPANMIARLFPTLTEDI